MDKARRKNDKRLKQIEKRLEKIYKEAEEDLYRKWAAYMLKAEKRLNMLYGAYVKEIDKEKKKALKKEYQAALSTYTLENKWYKDMVNQITSDLANINTIALNYVNGNMPYIYQNSYNQVANVYDFANMGISFDLVNEEAVENLINEGDITLPKKKIDIEKDKRWNTKALNSSVLQGIIQGESMADIAKRILFIVGMNKVAAMRNARTMVIGAENKGRLDSYKNLEKEGAVLKKVWIATISDGRTRKWHLSMHGQERKTSEPFIDGNGREIDYPGDPHAHPNTVYNCRCAIMTHLIGVRDKKGRIRKIKG